MGENVSLENYLYAARERFAECTVTTIGRYVMLECVKHGTLDGRPGHVHHNSDGWHWCRSIGPDGLMAYASIRGDRLEYGIQDSTGTTPHRTGRTITDTDSPASIAAWNAGFLAGTIQMIVGSCDHGPDPEIECTASRITVDVCGSPATLCSAHAREYRRWATDPDPDGSRAAAAMWSGCDRTLGRGSR